MSLSLQVAVGAALYLLDAAHIRAIGNDVDRLAPTSPIEAPHTGRGPGRGRLLPLADAIELLNFLTRQRRAYGLFCVWAAIASPHYSAAAMRAASASRSAFSSRRARR